MDIDLTKYKTIPGVSDNYLISETGEIINVGRKTPRSLKPAPSQRGYWVYTVIDSCGQLKRMSRHRLMMLAWRYPHGRDPYKLQVNHKNGIAGDDWLDNLEWCTAKENIRHAFDTGIRHSRYPIQVRYPETGIIVEYLNARICGEELGLSKDGVYFRCRQGENKVWPDGTQFRLKSQKPWYIPTQDEINSSVGTYGRRRGILVWFVFTNETMVFEGVTEAAKYLGVAVSTISVRADKPGHPTYPEGYQLRYVDDLTGWNICDDYYLDIEKHNPSVRFVAVLDTETNILSLSQLQHAAALTGIKKTTINMRLNSTSKNRTFGKYYIDYYSEFIKVRNVGDYVMNVL